MWLKIGIGAAILVAVVILYQRVMQMNKIVLAVLVFVVGTIVFFSWVYNRNEPKFLTPLVEKLAPFFPSADSFNQKQKKAP